MEQRLDVLSRERKMSFLVWFLLLLPFYVNVLQMTQTNLIQIIFSATFINLRAIKLKPFCTLMHRSLGAAKSLTLWKRLLVIQESRNFKPLCIPPHLLKYLGKAKEQGYHNQGQNHNLFPTPVMFIFTTALESLEQWCQSNIYC